MTASNQQIVSQYEELGMSAEEIAEQEDIDVTCVKATLMQCSSKYRKECTKVDDTNFTDEQHRMATDVIAQIAAGQIDDTPVSTRLKAAMYLKDDKKGRLDAVKQMNGLNINVNHFNIAFQRAIAARNRSRGIVIDTETTKEVVNG